MAEITLLRHGQASFGSDGYDQLSEIGEQQAFLYGCSLRELEENFDRVVAGKMLRYSQTVDGVMKGLQRHFEYKQVAEFNEYSFSGLLTPLKVQFPERWHQNGHARRDYYNNMKLALAYWMAGIIHDDGHDSWLSFCERVKQGFDLVCQK